MQKLDQKKYYFIFLLSILLMVASLFAISLKQIILNNIPTEIYSLKLVWSFLGILFVPSLLILCIAFDLPKSYQHSILKKDLFSYFSLFILFFIASINLSKSNIWISCLYLFLLFYKSILLTSILIFLARTKSNLSKIKFFLFIVTIWFFSSVVFWFGPLHTLTGDEPHYLLMTHSLIHDHDLNLYNEYKNSVYKVFYKGVLNPKPSDYIGPDQIYSKGLGSTYSYTLTPGYFLAGYKGVLIENIIIATLLLYNVFLLALDIGENLKYAIISTTITGSSLPILVYSSLVYPDLLGALIIIFLIRTLQRLEKCKVKKEVSLHKSSLFFLSFFLLLLKFRFISFVIPILISMLIIEIVHRKKILRFLFFILLSAIFYIGADLTIFKGDIFLTRLNALLDAQQFVPSLKSIVIPLGILLDQESGILFYSPIFFIFPLGIILKKSVRTITRLTILSFFPLVTFTLLGHFAWHNLPTPPLRYIFPSLLPLSTLGTQVWSKKVKKNSFQIISIYLFLGITIFISYLMLLNPSWLINLADGSSEILTSISKHTMKPFIYFFPSFIRLSASTLLWSVFFVIFCFFFYRKSKAYRNNQRFISMPQSVSVALLFILLFLNLISSHIPQNIEAEDILFSHPSGGLYFPAIRDPFFHRESHLGWQLNQNDSLQIRFLLNHHRSNILIRAKTKVPFGGSRLSIMIPSIHKRYNIKITGINWKNYLIPLYVQKENILQDIQIKCIGKQAIVIDNCKILQTSPINHFFLSHDNISQILSFSPKIYCYLYKHILLHHPGDPWYYFSKFSSKNKVLPLQLPSSSHYPITNGFVSRTCSTALEAGWDYLFQFEHLFNFSAINYIHEKDLPTYFTNEIKSNNRIIYKELESYISRNPNYSLKQALVLAYFQAGDYRKSIHLLSDIIIQNRDKRCRLIQPQTLLEKSNEFFPDFETLSTQPNFIKSAKTLLSEILFNAKADYKNDDFASFYRALFKLYVLDKEFLLNSLNSLDPIILLEILPFCDFLSSNDLLGLANNLAIKNRFDDALFCLHLSIQKNKSDSKGYYLCSVIQKNRNDLDKAYSCCISSINTCFTNDSARMFLKNILKSIHELNLSKGFSK